ncbi:MAG: DUF2630 family protein [Actinobacteria bacterium]|nr:DUF2630 family protein [Actinomycetota bacterium]MBV8960672.1 DUF2630 family protein [Actinomycetota bacterium]MBV9254072.1 DUF2630 family protein [Actinomycetota bacterium]
MADDDLIQQIDDLVAEEHRLFEHSTSGKPLSDDDERRLKDLEVRLDQCWDLLRQRRARRNAGLDPDDTAVRDASVVEGYQQ